MPDHVIEEITSLSTKMAHAIYPLLDCDPNIVLGALNYLHAAMINNLVSQSDLEKAAVLTAESLIDNVKFLKERNSDL